MRLTGFMKLFLCVIGFSLLTWVIVVMRRSNSYSDLAFLDSQMNMELERLQRKIKESQDTSARLKVALMEKGVKQSEIDAAIKSVNDGSFTRDIPSSRQLNREFSTDTASLAKFQRSVTVIIHSEHKNSDCLISQVKEVRKHLPQIKIIIASTIDVQLPITEGLEMIPTSSTSTEGAALNTMMHKVKTPFFLYLSQGATVYPFNTDNGPGWLLHALENVPELDFIGASILAQNKTLKYAQLDIQCHRTKMCYYVFGQTYEYKYSVGDVMICEEISTSFMGRLVSLGKVGPFDETLNSMVTNDFFWRAKQKALLGLRPEVFFPVSKACYIEPLSTRDRSLKKQAFMEKYELVRVKDSYGLVTEFPNPPRPEPYTKNIWGRPFNYVADGGFASPLMTEKLRYYLKFFEEFFISQNITYFTDAGAPLGSVKMRNVLPWDTGDVDAGYWDVSWQQILPKMQEYCKLKNVPCEFHADDATFKLNVGQTNGLKSIHSTVGTHHGAHYDLYPHAGWDSKPEHEAFMYIMIDGIRVPVLQSLFRSFRSEYGLSYFVMAGSGGALECKVKGHHACVPEAFKYGGGHWKDFYCNL